MCRSRPSNAVSAGIRPSVPSPLDSYVLRVHVVQSTPTANALFLGCTHPLLRANPLVANTYCSWAPMTGPCGVPAGASDAAPHEKCSQPAPPTTHAPPSSRPSQLAQAKTPCVSKCACVCACVCVCVRAEAPHEEPRRSSSCHTRIPRKRALRIAAQQGAENSSTASHKRLATSQAISKHSAPHDCLTASPHPRISESLNL